MKFIAFSRERPDIHGDRKNENKSGGVLGFIKKNTVLMVALAAAPHRHVIHRSSGQGVFRVFRFQDAHLPVLRICRWCARCGTSTFSISSPAGLSSCSGTRGCAVTGAGLYHVHRLDAHRQRYGASSRSCRSGYYRAKHDRRAGSAIWRVTFILQNIAANLGGMLTPFGNPQNLYLYSHFSIPTGEFMSDHVPARSSVSIAADHAVLPAHKARADERCPKDDAAIPAFRPVRAARVSVRCSRSSIVIVFRVIPYMYRCWRSSPSSILLLDQQGSCAMVDYPLLLHVRVRSSSFPAIWRA